MSLHRVERPAVGPPRGVVWLLHGVGANEQSLAMVAHDQDPDIRVILARAPLNFGPGAYGWFQVRFEPQGPVIDPDQAEASRRLLIDEIAALQADSGIGPERTLVAGSSQGGIMSASVALTAPERVAGFGLVSGRILPEIAPKVPADIARHALQGLVLHGRRDSKLPFSMAQASDLRLNELRVAHELRAYDEDHAFSAAMRQDFRDWVSRQFSAAG